MLVVANWKMFLTHTQSIVWVKNNKTELHELLKNNKIHMVLCPTFTALSSIHSLLAHTTISLGAQECSLNQCGAYTGEVSPLSLKEIGCSYCIIGHSEQRIHFQQSNDSIAKKAVSLMLNSIEPILCVGEMADQRYDMQSVLSAQLKPVLEETLSIRFKRLTIAYEPRWAIGTGIIPSVDELHEAFTWVKSYINNYKHLDVTLLYGGSVEPRTIESLKQVSIIQGFLIGRASTDFEQLRSILQKI